MKYLASNIVERAFDLSDLKNTDFLSHNEIQEYLNDAWKGVYQWLINKGDKQFVKEIYLGGYSFGTYTEYKIPVDLYQILSLKEAQSGRIIPRHSESESINSNTYEIVNDRIRLYGVTANQLILTYYTTPVYITYPDRNLYPTINTTTLSSAGNAVLYSNGSIYNIVTGEALGAITITAGRTYVLGNGHVFSYSGTNIKYENYNGGQISTSTVAYTPVTCYDRDFNVCYQTKNNNVYGSVIRNSKVIGSNPNHRKCLVVLRDAFIYQDDLGHLIVSDNINEVFTTTETYSGVSAIPFNDKSFIVGYNGEYHMITLDDDYSLVDTLLDHIDVFNPIGMMRYGLLANNGSEYSIISWWPDTEFNFPNELYISLIACDLACRFLTKQNADSTGLNNLYTNMQTQFMNMLSQDSNYSRITKVYR